MRTEYQIEQDEAIALDEARGIKWERTFLNQMILCWDAIKPLLSDIPESIKCSPNEEWLKDIKECAEMIECFAIYGEVRS